MPCAFSPPAATAPSLILASSSPYRRELLSRLRLDFEAISPDLDERALPGEAPPAQARRLALAKAQAVAARHPAAVVIGSDQVAELRGQALGKPGDHAGARAQLLAMSGERVLFHTALAVVCESRGFVAQDLAPVSVQMRSLTEDEVEAYLALEQPFDCAGSAKVEGLGIALLDSVESDDPTALIGLPLIRTCRLLRQAGVPLLGGGAA